MMKPDELRRLIRERFPFPIAHAHKKTLGVLDENLEKLKCLLETAEVTMQFLGLLALAQVRHDLLKDALPSLGRLRDDIALTTPSFGKWTNLTRSIMKIYSQRQDQLVTPELFDVFWHWDAARQQLRSQKLDNTTIGQLIALRNDFHHGRVPDSLVSDKVHEGLAWLHQFLEALQFLAEYELSFIQRILVEQREAVYIHDLTLFTGCLYEPERRTFSMQMDPGTLIFLHKQHGRHLRLEPFLVYREHLKGPDIYLLNNMAHNRAGYVSAQFTGDELRTNDNAWPEGRACHEMLREFLEKLQGVGSAPPDIPTEPEAPHPIEEASSRSTAEVFHQQYTTYTPAIQHSSPYKFLDYYNPEDQDIFFGREREIRMLEQKFYTSRLLVLHGESGSGKTSLIRAGLIPRLDPEAYIPVYVRMLHEPLQEITRELLRQLGIEPVKSPDRFPETCQDSLLDLLFRLTAQVSKTVVIVLDQFEEFFLRFPDGLRARFQTELAECVHAPRLDVKFLLALRSEYFAGLASFEDAIPTIFTHQLHLEQLSESQALEAVVKPAARLNIQVDEAMVQIKLLPELISEEGGIEPPLLQIVCDALYQHAQSEGRQQISMADYEAIGNVNACLGQYLDSKLRQFGRNQPTARAVLKTLVSSEGTKRASFAEEILSRLQNLSPSSQFFDSNSPPGRGQEGNPPDGKNSPPGRGQGWGLSEQELTHNYLDKFVRDRLLRVEEVEGKARYELSHDYLATHIEAWIADSERELTKILELIDRAYEAYQATALLLERSALQMIKPCEDQLVLPAEKQAFLARSKTQSRRQRRGLLLKIAAALMFVALVVGGIFGYQTYQQYQEALRQKEIALARQQEAEKERKHAEQQTELANLNELKALTETSKALFLAHDELSALLAGVKAGIKAKDRHDLSTTFKYQVILNLREVVYGIHERNRVHGHLATVNSIAFSPDGTLCISGSRDKTLKLWNVANGRMIRTLYGHLDLIYTVAFSPDGTMIASGSNDDTIKLWSVADGREIQTLTGHSDAVYAVTFSPDGAILASGDRDDVIKLWDIAERKVIKTLYGHAGKSPGRMSSGISELNFSPDGKLLVSASWDHTIKLWDLHDGREIRTLHHADVVRSVMFSADGTRLVSGSDDKTIKLWDAATGQELKTFKGHTDTVRDVYFTHDQQWIISGSWDKTIKVWDIESGREMATLARTSVPVTSLHLSADGQILAAGYEGGSMSFLNVNDRMDDVTLYGHSHAVTSVDFSPDGTQLVSGSFDTTIKLWNVSDRQELRTLSEHSDAVRSVRFSPDGSLLASGDGKDDTTIKLWSTADWQVLRTLRGHSDRISTLCFGPNGEWLASGSYDNTIKLWDVDDGSEIATLRGHSRQIHGIACSSDGRTLASASEDGTIKLWDSVTHRAVKTLVPSPDFFDRVRSVDFSQDGSLLVSGEGEWRTIKLWNFADGKERATLYGHSDEIFVVKFSPDQRLLASGSFDKMIKLWNVKDGTELGTLEGHGERVLSLDFHPDGTLLASGGTDNTIKLWNLDVDDLILQGCQCLHPYLKYNPNVSPEDRQLCTEYDVIAYQQQIDAHPDHAAAWNNLGEALWQQGQLGEAITAFQKQTESTPNHAEAWNNLGIALQVQNRNEEAIRAFQRQVEVTPEHDQAWGNLGAILESQGKSDEAFAAYQHHAETLHAKGKLDQAIPVYQQLLETQPDNASILYNLGRAFQALDEWDEALTMYQDVLELEAVYQDIHYYMGQVLLVQGKLEEALKSLKKHDEIKPEQIEVWFKLGRAFYRQNKFDTACTVFQKVVEISPDHCCAWYYLGNGLRKQGKLDEAIAAYQRQLAITPNHPHAWNNLGWVLFNQDKLKEAGTAFRQQLEITPNHESAWNNLGNVLLKQGKLDEAVAAYRKQIEIIPDHEAAWHNLGLVLFSQGKFKEAIEAYGHKLEINSHHE